MNDSVGLGEKNGGRAVRESYRLLKVSEVARLLSVGESTVRKLIYRREIPALRVGGSWRLDPDAIVNYLASRRP